MPASLPPEARARLDQHLDAVEAALLAAGNSRDQRRAILDDLESQIRDMLAAKSALPQLSDVENILAQLDQPQAYAPTAELKETSPPEQPVAPPTVTPPVPKMLTPAPAARRRKYMRPVVLIALIICGTVLVMTPAFIDVLHQRNFLEYSRITLANPVPTNVRLTFDTAPMDGVYRFGFWLTGSAAIVFAIIGGFIAFVRDSRHPSHN